MFSTVEDQADFWLANWSKWTRGDKGISGYPRRSVTECAREGGIEAGSPKPPTELPEEEAKTDRAVAALGSKRLSILRQVIGLCYERGLPMEGIAEELACSRSEARHLLGRAKRAIYRLRVAL